MRLRSHWQNASEGDAIGGAVPYTGNEPTKFRLTCVQTVQLRPQRESDEPKFESISGGSVEFVGVIIRRAAQFRQ